MCIRDSPPTDPLGTPPSRRSACPIASSPGEAGQRQGSRGIVLSIMGKGEFPGLLTGTSNVHGYEYIRPEF
eukprot:9070579-Pyramimonas_sp.AAC.1